MNIPTLFALLYTYKGLKCKYDSLESLKSFIKDLHDGIMKEEDLNDAGWVASGNYETVVASSDINLIIEFIEMIKPLHPQMDEFLSGLEYFKPHAEEIGSRFIQKGRTYDIHNCLLRKEGASWVWKSADKEHEPQAIRTTVFSTEAPRNYKLNNIFNMINDSYYNLNLNSANALKSIVELDADGNRGNEGYDIQRVIGKEAHGFQTVGDVNYDPILKGMQVELRMKLKETFTDGSLRLINYLDYPNSKKSNNAGYSDIPTINIYIENEFVEIDFKGDKVQVPSTKTNNKVLTPQG